MHSIHVILWYEDVQIYSHAGDDSQVASRRDKQTYMELMTSTEIDNEILGETQWNKCAEKDAVIAALTGKTNLKHRR